MTKVRLIKYEREFMFAPWGVSYFGKLGNIQVLSPMLSMPPLCWPRYAKSSIGVKKKVSRAKRTNFTDPCPFVIMVVHHSDA